MKATQQSHRKKSITFWLCLLGSAAVIFLQFFRWNIVDIFTPFLAMPIELAFYIIFLVSCIFAIVNCFKSKHSIPTRFVPILINVTAFGLAYFVPFTKLWLACNFHINRNARDRVIAEVIKGQLKPNVSHNSSLIHLDNHSYVSAGGNDIVVFRTERGYFILFYTFRGILGNAAGFLWSSPGTNLAEFEQLNGPTVEFQNYKNGWHYVSMH